MANLMNALGLMSGTSLDGIDAALIRTDGEAVVERGPAMTFPYSPAQRARLRAGLEAAVAMTQRDQRPGDLGALERDLTLWHADAVAQFRKAHDIQPDIIGFHGQTVLHRPAQALTVQLGDGRLLAAETGIQVVADMRAADIHKSHRARGKACGKGCVIGGHQGGTLPACGDIGGAHVGYHLNARFRSYKPAIAQLHG